MPNARFACLAAAALAGAVALLATVGEFADAGSPYGAWLRAGWPDPASSLLVAISVGLAASCVVGALALSFVAIAELIRLIRKLELLSLSDEPVRLRLQQYFAATVLAKDGDALLNHARPDADDSIDRALAARSFRALCALLIGSSVALSLYRLAFADAAAADVARLLLPPVAAALVVAATLLLARWIVAPLAQDALAAGASALAWVNGERAIARAEDQPAPLTEAIELLRADLQRWRGSLEARLPSALDSATLRLRAAAPPSADEIGAAVARAILDASESRAQRIDTVLHEVLDTVSQQRDAARDLNERLDNFAAAEPRSDNGLRAALSSFLQDVNSTRTGTGG